MVWTEMCGQLEEILAVGCTGVILSLVKAVWLLSSSQTKVLVALTAALHC